MHPITQPKIIFFRHPSRCLTRNRECRYGNILSGSINLKPIGNLSIDDFRNDFEINVIGAVKQSKNTFQH
jgi:hypothetical protein